MSRLLERLRKYQDNRGMMANLRCILVENKKHRAWPALNRLGVPIKDKLSAFIAGVYATHPEETSSGNFGATCKAIERKRDNLTNDDSKLTPTERRFQHLLAAGNEDELYERILRLVVMAKSQGVPINYVQLESDLRSNDDWRKTEWGSSFWTPNAASAVEEGE